MHRLIFIGILLAAAPLRSQTHGFVEGRSRLYYESIGSGSETIIVVNGGPGLPHDYMRPEWDRLAGSGRVIYYDQNGCGQSGRVPPFGWRSHVEDLQRLIDSLAPDKPVVLAGSSWGSMLVLYFAYEHPDRVKALILSGVPGKGGGAAKESTSWQLPSQSRLDSINRGLPVGPGIPGPPLESRLQQRIRETCFDIGIMISRSLGDAPWGQRLKRMTAPTLVIHGSNPDQVPPDGGPAVAAIVPNARLFTIANAGHDAWLDQPAVFFKAANEFLAGLSPTHLTPNPR